MRPATADIVALAEVVRVLAEQPAGLGQAKSQGQVHFL